MDTISFQPKSQVPEESKPIVNVAEAVAGIKGLYIGEHKSIVTIIFTVLPVLVGCVIFGLMMVNSSLQSEADALAGNLSTKDGEINKITKIPMKDIKQLSDRIQIVSQVIKSQAFTTSFLKTLEYSVEDGVIFQKTTLSSVTKGGSVGYTFSIDSTALTYADVVSQIQTLKNTPPYNKLFTDVKMTGFGVDKKGVISFKITGDVVAQNLTPEEVDIQLSGRVTIDTATSSVQTPVSQPTTP